MNLKDKYAQMRKKNNTPKDIKCKGGKCKSKKFVESFNDYGDKKPYDFYYLLSELSFTIKADDTLKRDWGGKNYKCTVKYNKTSKSYTTQYTNSIAAGNDKPIDGDILECLLNDAEAYMHIGDDTAEWCIEFGYNLSDIKEVREIIKNSKKTYEFFSSFLTDDEIYDAINSIR